MPPFHPKTLDSHPPPDHTFLSHTHTRIHSHINTHINTLKNTNTHTHTHTLLWFSKRVRMHLCVCIPCVCHAKKIMMMYQQFPRIRYVSQYGLNSILLCCREFNVCNYQIVHGLPSLSFSHPYSLECWCLRHGTALSVRA